MQSSCRIVPRRAPRAGGSGRAGRAWEASASSSSSRSLVAKHSRQRSRVSVRASAQTLPLVRTRPSSRPTSRRSASVSSGSISGVISASSRTHAGQRVDPPAMLCHAGGLSAATLLCFQSFGFHARGPAAPAAGAAGCSLARDLCACADIDDVDGEIDDLGAEGGSEIVVRRIGSGEGRLHAARFVLAPNR
jgi:hypothetical protein